MLQENKRKILNLQTNKLVYLDLEKFIIFL